MKNAQAKIDTLLDTLVDNLQDRIAEAGVASEAHFVELERLTNLSNLNNKRKEVIEKPSPQGKAVTMSDEDLVKDLKAARDPDQFPRRGPRKGKRENAGKPLPPEPPFCAIHTGVICVVGKIYDGPDTFHFGEVCPECAKEPPKEFVSLKALL